MEGIIKRTRTVMECMHRFCRECIDKSMRLGNNECPACRTHCASRRSLRDDPRYDALIAALYPDIEKYEEEELTFHEEERARNKQIQESIAQIFRRQSEALVRRRTTRKDTAAASTERVQRNYQNAYSRRRRNNQVGKLPVSDDNDDENDNGGKKDSSSTDDRGIEMKHKRGKRQAGGQMSQPSPLAANLDGKCIENDLEASRESRGISAGSVWNTERLAWGRGGARSHARYGSASNSKNVRNSRLSRLVEYLQGLNEYGDEYVAHETSQAENVELPALKETPEANGEQSTLNDSTLTDDHISSSQIINQCKVGLQVLEGQEALAGLGASCSSSSDHLIVAYQQETN